MTLDDDKKKIVAKWINEGLKLSDIQKKLDAELGVRMTYMEVRFLVDDLKLMPKDQEPPKQPEKKSDLAKPAAATPAGGSKAEEPVHELPEAAGGTGKVSVSVDAVTRPGALVSGTVTFSDSQTAVWYLDQMGRLGLAPKQQGYRPAPADLQEFQAELQIEMQRLGF